MEGDWVQYLFAGEEAGQWSPFSSIGPTLDGRNKPDVSAPGRCIVSAYSSYYLEENPTATSYDVAHFDVNGRTYPWRVDSGTSMSTPVVAGIIALWLQAKPDLTRDDIMGVIQRTCRHPEEDLDYPNNKYGYGEIDAYRGLLDILGVTAIKEISQHEPSDARIWASDGLLHIVFDNVPTTPVAVTIYTTGGSVVDRSPINTNDNHVILPLPTLGKGIYVVQIGTSGSALIRI
jgi:subtilisin family serine protease